MFARFLAIMLLCLCSYAATLAAAPVGAPATITFRKVFKLSFPEFVEIKVTQVSGNIYLLQGGRYNWGAVTMVLALAGFAVLLAPPSTRALTVGLPQPADRHRRRPS